MNTRKTKKELLEMIEEKEADINSLHKEIDNLEKYKLMDDSADEIRRMYDSYINVGFTDNQAFELVRIILSTTIQKHNR